MSVPHTHWHTRTPTQCRIKVLHLAKWISECKYTLEKLSLKLRNSS